MTTSPTPEQSAKAILDIFKSQNCIAGDPLKISYVKAQFLENHGGAGQYAAGLMYAEDNGWLEEQITDKIRRRVVSGTQGTMGYWRMKAGAHAGEHKHPHEQFVWMVKGTMDFRIGNASVPAPSSSRHFQRFRQALRREVRRGGLERRRDRPQEHRPGSTPQ